MKMIANTFKQALKDARVQYGLWLGMADPLSAELCAGAGFDWLLIDAEHAPNDVRTVLAQLQAVAAYDSHPVVRPVEGSQSVIKQMLDLGAQTLLVPMVETAEQAEALVRAVRYPPHGNRGVGTALARAARWNRVEGYFEHADDEICLIVQVESATALEALDDIAAVDGVDAVFIGPADLAASLGHLGNPAHPDVKQIIENALKRIRDAGKAPGILCVDPVLARNYVEHGALFVAVGVDTVMLSKAVYDLAAAFKE